MDFLEKDLEDIIWEAQKTDNGRDLLSKRGLDVQGMMYRQVYLAEYGRLDLLGVEIISQSDIKATIYELKQGRIGIETIMQACRYGTGVREYIEKKYNLNRPVKIRFVLLGKSLDTSSDFVFLHNHFNDSEIYTYQYKVDGLYFNREPKTFYVKDSSLELLNLSICRGDIEQMKNRRVMPF